ncbi:uncharacterized protein EI97DRAFT_441193 [Westerdykella ornata]|uniref:Uncharacterized protein n=1 Tax=Westerdykella ornata TaxID=318751 RepID=A0A6A6JNR5_WESOR|nr:uncharacterized protein EI97DRAFT_441193 [Westerdykella ornata]KAF2277904.1 hypothetical protein EI97DRAFT_441193 [Westerdykella ornata]
MAAAKRQVSFANLNDNIKDRIFNFAGREAVFAYDIATGGQERHKPYVKNNAFYEPFTYWDWHGTDSTYQEDDKRKRRLFWDRERGYRTNAGQWSSYPSPSRRWKMFRERINDDTRGCVKRIALARWMTREDLKWVCEELPALEALGLSAIQTFEGQSPLTDDLGEVDWHGIAHLLRNTDSKYSTSNEQPNILKRLKWLGLANVVHTLKHTPGPLSLKVLKDEGNDPFSTVLPICSQLQTLSIRAPCGADSHYWTEQPLQGMYAHQEICKPILRITQNAPETVRTLELRQYFDYLPQFLEKLHELKPSIKKVGIDLGAWVQTFPIRPPLLEEKVAFVTDDEIEGNVQRAVHFTEYLAQLEKKEPLTESPKETLYTKPTNRYLALEAKQEKATQDNLHLDALYKQQSNTFYSRTSGTDYPFLPRHDPNYDFSRDYCCLLTEQSRLAYMTQDAEYCPLNVHDFVERRRLPESPFLLKPTPEELDLADRNRTNTLPQMLKKLYDLRDAEPKLYALGPEPQNRSNDPVDPLALVQMRDEATEWGYEEGAGSRYRDFTADEDFTEIYTFLKKRFNWRPVFDWDALMVPEEVEQRVDRAFKKMIMDDEKYLERIAKHFGYLRKAEIPVHVLIGRRKTGTSSCYWGWPYDERKWREWLRKDFDANLGLVVGDIDTLSIYYDLRNPLDEKRLEEIEIMQPLRRPHASCPQVPCPWGSGLQGKINRHRVPSPAQGGDCPFLTQRQPLSGKSLHHTKGAAQRKQKMANKSTLASKFNRTQSEYANLAPHSASPCAPPTGRNAHAYSSDSDLEDPQTGIPPLHYLARTAAYTRESLGWQRFWTRYALHFSRLTSLNVRMPAALDDLSIGGSVRLARLLDRKVGWVMGEFTDERQQVQTREDLEDTLDSLGGRREVFEHVPEVPVWSGGRFVTRWWVWPEKRGEWLKVGEGPKQVARFEQVPNPGWPERSFAEEDFQHTEGREKEECKKGKAGVVVAVQREKEAEQRLRVKLGPAAREKQRRKKLYIDGAVLVAQEKWETLLQREIEGLERDLTKVENLSTESYEKTALLTKVQRAIDWLRLRQKEKAPILAPSLELFDNENDIKAALGWKNAKEMKHTWIPQHWLTDIVQKDYEYGFWRQFDVEEHIAELRQDFLKKIDELQQNVSVLRTPAIEVSMKDISEEKKTTLTSFPQTPPKSDRRNLNGKIQCSSGEQFRIDDANMAAQLTPPASSSPKKRHAKPQDVKQQSVSPTAKSILKSITIVVDENPSSNFPTPPSGAADRTKTFTLPGLGAMFGDLGISNQMSHSSQGSQLNPPTQDAQSPNAMGRKCDIEIDAKATAKQRSRERSSTASTSTSCSSSVHDLIQEQLEGEHVEEEETVQEMTQEVVTIKVRQTVHQEETVVPPASATDTKPPAASVLAQHLPTVSPSPRSKNELKRKENDAVAEEPLPRKKARMDTTPVLPALKHNVEESESLLDHTPIPAQEPEPMAPPRPKWELREEAAEPVVKQEPPATPAPVAEEFIKVEPILKPPISKKARRSTGGKATADPLYKYEPEEDSDEDDADLLGGGDDDDLGDAPRKKGRGGRKSGDKRRRSKLEYAPSDEDEDNDSEGTGQKASKGKGRGKSKRSTGTESRASKRRKVASATLVLEGVGDAGGDAGAGNAGEGNAPTTPPPPANKAAKGGRKKRVIPRRS